MTALHFAASGKHFEIAKLLIEKGADVNAKDGFGNGPLFRTGNCEEIGILLMENGADPDMENNYGICPRKNAIPAYQYIRSYLNDTEKYPATQNFAAAAEIGDTYGIEYYIAKGADVNQPVKGGTALSYAASQQKMEIVKMLIAAGATIDVADSAQNTPLFWAAINGNFDMVKLLVEHGANIHAVNKWGNSIMGASEKYPEIVEYLQSKV